AAAQAQAGLAEHAWPDDAVIKVRMGLHTGEGILGGDNYVGLDVNKAARVASAGHGGQVLFTEQTQAALAQLPDTVKVRNLGEHRLKDFPEPGRIFQLEIKGLPADFPPLRAIGRNNLPSRLTPLVGRTEEVERALGLLKDNRLVTLTGPGGTGKTRLAIEVAERAKYDFMDGAFFVALAPITDPVLLATTVAHALGLEMDPNTPVPDAVQAHLEGKDLLLVLDNFEQILAAGPQVGELLQAAPRLKVVATSREALHVSGEQEYPVPPLALPELEPLPELEALSQFEAVALFIQRARAAKPDFEVTSQNAPAVAEITVRLDGLPLAIELAAARIKILTPDGILGRLGSRLSLLTSKAADVPARQQTLRDTIGWSYELLSADEQGLFRRLGIFVSGFTVESAEAIVAEAADLDAFEGIASLVDKNLVRRYEAHGEERFHMLETIREYAREQLQASGEEDDAAARHLAYFLALAKDAQPHLLGEDQATWIDRLDHEHGNLRAAISWGAERDVAAALELGGTLWRFWHLRGHLQEGRERLEGLLGLPAAREPTLARSTALDGLAGMVYWQGDYPRARDLYLEALEINRRLGDKRLVAWTLGSIGSTLSMGGDDAAAMPYLEESLGIARDLGDPDQVAMHAGGVAFMRAFSGDLAGARPLLEEALTATRQVGNVFWESTGEYLEGWIGTREGRYDEAHGHYVRSLEVALGLGDKTAVALALSGLADLALEEGNLERALRIAGASLAIRDEIGGGAPPESMRARDPRDASSEAIGAEATERAWNEGLTMGYDAALEYARTR
ncbi:MAG TPA: tetratricopeptide repeat protein, partial [Actinomycetota bacterium]|nr:tetratricopeptide repeat protein [Actinomycetota bacterium]